MKTKKPTDQPLSRIWMQKFSTKYQQIESNKEPCTTAKWIISQAFKAGSTFKSQVNRLEKKKKYINKGLQMHLNMCNIHSDNSSLPINSYKILHIVLHLVMRNSKFSLLRNKVRMYSLLFMIVVQDAYPTQFSRIKIYV